MGAVPDDKQGAIPHGQEQRRPRNGSGRGIPRAFHLHARQAEKRADKVHQAHLKETLPGIR